MSKKEIKLLFAAVDIGWRIEHYSAFLNSHFGKSIKIKSFVKYKVSSQQYLTKYDYEVQYSKISTIFQWVVSFSFFLYALIKFNTFYFFSGETILTRKLRRLEFKIYKLLNKKVIMHFVGSDVRNPELLYWREKNISSYLIQDQNYDKTKDWQESLIKDSTDFLRTIIVSTPDLLRYVKDANFYPVLINTNKFFQEIELANRTKTDTYFKTNKIKILHAPSNIKLKGTSLIVEVVQSLIKEGLEIEFLCTADLKRKTGSVYSISRYELFNLYQEADIVIDQMIIGWYGLQSVEALLAKCLVICFIDESLKTFLPPSCPINTSNILELGEAIKKEVKRSINGEIDFIKQIEWVKKHHTIESNNQLLIDAIVK